MSKKEDIDDKTKAILTKKGYQLLGLLGQGSVGLVYKAKNFKKDDQICAVKVMDMSKMSPKLRDKFVPRALAALMEVKHPNCVQVYDIFKMRCNVFIFLEFAGNGDLSGYMKEHKNLREELARWLFKQTCEAVRYLHNEAKMSHGNIKLDSIILDGNNQAKLTRWWFKHTHEAVSYPSNVVKMAHCDAKLDDIGSVDLITDDSDTSQLVSETYGGTLAYYSPQLVAKKPYNPFKADVWAMGVVLYTMLCNRSPFHFQDIKKLHNEQTKYPTYIESRFLDSVTGSARNLLLKLLDPEEETRPMMSEVMQHEWFNAQ